MLPSLQTPRAQPLYQQEAEDVARALAVQDVLAQQLNVKADAEALGLSDPTRAAMSRVSYANCMQSTKYAKNDKVWSLVWTTVTTLCISFTGFGQATDNSC